MRWYAVLFWIWVAVSLGIFLYRRVTGVGRSDDAATEDPVSPLDREWAPPPPDPEGLGDDGPTVGAPIVADVSTPSSPPQSPATGTRSLVDLLEGIRLPHDLVPLTQSAPSSGPITSLVAGTTTATAEEVGTALADELERLGYSVTTTGDQTALAEGPRGAVEIEIHPDAAHAYDGGNPRFPTASSGSVVVEMRVGQTRR